MARTKIITPSGARIEIQRRTGATQPTIRKALNGENTKPEFHDLYTCIRSLALEMGGVEVETTL